MKKFTKLALAASVALSANAMAMQAMDDSTLSATTGQDGINIGIGISKIEIEKLFIHDNDGLDSTLLGGSREVKDADDVVTTPYKAGTLGGTDTAGAIEIRGNGKGFTATKGLVITAPGASTGTVDTTRLFDTHNLVDLRIDSDAGTSTTGGAFLNIAADVAGLDIYIGEVGVTASGTQGAAKNADDSTNASLIRRGGTNNNYNKILSGLTLKTGKMTANIQVGAAPQGAMINLDTVMLGGLEIADLGILDNSTTGKEAYTGKNTTAAGEIFIKSIKVADASGTDLTVKANVAVFGANAQDQGFLKITSTSNAHDIYVKEVRLGSQTAGSIGDIEVQGLQTYYGPTMTSKGSVITISGH